MSKKQLAALFLCCLVPRIVGNGLVPLLPVYAKQLGANAALAGYYLALVNVAVSVGALSGSWVSGRFGRKVPLFVASLGGVGSAYIMSRATTVWELTVGTALLWFCGGLVIALAGILAGLSAPSNERGKIFGILVSTVGVGSLIGGLGVGWIVDRAGYATLFKALILVEGLWPLFALLVEEKDSGPSPAEDVAAQRPPDRRTPGLGQAFYLLFSASILISITAYIIPLVRSLTMSDLGFSALAITSTTSIGALIALPLPVVLGWMSDRTGRKPLLFVVFLAALAGVTMLAFSTALWSFWVVIALRSIALQGDSTLGSAMVTDLIPRSSFSKAMARFTATQWIGAVIGYGVAGYALQNLGLTPTLALGGCLALGAIGLLTAIRVRPQPGEDPKVLRSEV